MRYKILFVENSISHLPADKGYVKNVDRVIRNLHINCCSTIGEEPLSGTIIEGFINHTTVIATKTGGSPELIQHKETGLLIEPNSVNDFIRGVELLYNNNNLMKNMATNAYDFAKNNLSNDIYSERISSIYREILTEKQS